jgi:transposase
MKKPTRQYTQEFKLQAIKLAEELGSAIQAGKQLGVPDANIYVWRKKHAGQTVSAAKKPEVKSDDLAKENLRLQQEVLHLKKVNHILKSAAAFFSQDHLK